MIVDANAVLAVPVAVQVFQPVARRYTEIVQCLSRIESYEPTEHHPVQLRREWAHGFSCKKPGGVPIGKTLDHRSGNAARS